MDTKIKKLMVISILFYLNNFVLIFFAHKFGLEGITVIWFFTPFMFVLFTTSMLECSKIGQRKKLSIVDFSLRCIVVVINFLAISKIIYLPVMYLILLGITFMMANLYVERKWYKQMRILNVQEEEVLTKQQLDNLCEDYATTKSILQGKSEDDKEELQNMYRSILCIGYSHVLLALLIGGGVFAFSFFGEEYRFVIMMIATLLVGVYLYLTNKKIMLFFKDENERKKIHIRDNGTFIVGISIIYVLQGYIYIGTGVFHFFGIFVALLFFIPTIKTNHIMREAFHQTNKKYLV